MTLVAPPELCAKNVEWYLTTQPITGQEEKFVAYFKKKGCVTVGDTISQFEEYPGTKRKFIKLKIAYEVWHIRPVPRSS